VNYRSLTNPDDGPRAGDGLEADYRALTETAGVRLCAERLVIRMSGGDRASFLHGMCSNDINGLKPGYLVPALFLTERAHLIGEANVWAVADALLLEMDRALWPAVRAQLERFLVADDVELEEDGDAFDYRIIQIDGPRSVAAVAAAFAFLGHLFPVWLRFRGGKGVATAGGILLAYAWPAALAAIATWLVIAALTRYSSLAALIGASLAPVYTWFFTREFQQTEVALFLAILIVLRHHANIRRLIRGEESKIKLGKS